MVKLQTLCALNKPDFKTSALMSLVLGVLLIFVNSLANADGDCRQTSGSSINATLDRLYYRSALHWDGTSTWSHAPGYGTHFSGSDLSATSDLSSIYIAKIWEPNPADVKNVVVLSAGQSTGDGVHNGVTGQPNDYKWNGENGSSRSITIADNSLARKVMNRFNSSDTALVLIFDNNSRYEYSSSRREKVKDAFSDWIYSLADDPDLLYFAGSSRGGALAMMVGTELTNASNFPKLDDTLFAIQGIDPVFRAGEYGVTTGDKIQNPLETSIWKSWKAQELDIRAQFGNDMSRINRSMVKVITTGDQVVLVAEGALPWGEWSTGDPHSGDNELDILHIYDAAGNAYYEGSWVDIEHKDLGRDYCTGPDESNNQIAFRDNPMLHHLDNVLARQACGAHGKWNYSCSIRTGCPVNTFSCICDAPYVSDGAGSCKLDCPVGEVYDSELDACVEKCPSALNQWWDPATGACACTDESNWSPTTGCTVCGDSDWDFYNQSCCPTNAPNYDGAHNECYADCGPDAYWDFDPSSNLGHCVDYCPPCEDPKWEIVCNDKTRTCTREMFCRPQCEEGEICGTTPNVFGYDYCMTQEVLGPKKFKESVGSGSLGGRALSFKSFRNWFQPKVETSTADKL